MLLIMANEKGGTGKTTVAVGLACAWSRRHRVLLVDTDPQASAAAWLDGVTGPEVIVQPRASGLGGFLEQQAARPDVEIVVVDTPPGLPPALREAVRVADHIVVPVRPSAVDLRALNATLDLIRLLAPETARVQVVITQAIVGTVLAHEAQQAAREYGAPVCRTVIHHRVAHALAAQAGRPIFQYAPDSLATVELDQLAREVWKDAHEDAQLVR
jgi:chromosome partitioning protein